MISPRSGPIPKWLPLLFIGIGIIFVILGVGFRYSTVQFIERANTTEGLVVRLVGDTQKSPVVRFHLPNGEAVTFESSLSTRPPRYEVEEKVMVYYDPEDPENAMIDGWMEEWFATIVFGGMGSLFALISIGAFFTTRRI